MSRLDRYPYPDAQTAHDVFANRLALFTAPRDVHDELAMCIIADVRTIAEHRAGAVPTAMHLPAITKETAPAVKGHDIVVVYDDGYSTRAEQAAVTLAALGHHVKVMVGGFAAWQAAGLPVA